MRAYWSSSVASVCGVITTMCALVLVVCVLPADAVAAPPALIPPQSFEVQAELESAGGTAAEAKENLAIQHQASRVDLVGQLEEELGQTYASVWFDNETGEFVVPVATAGDGGAATEASE